VLDGISPGDVELMLSKLGLARENLREAIGRNGTQERPATERAKRYG
jgi:hypothetical protein